jgi:membrane associated rhomboid family serine protease
VIPLRDDVLGRQFPLVTVALITLNVAVYLYELALWLAPGSGGEGPRLLSAFLREFGLVPCRVGAACPSATSTLLAGAPAPWVTVFSAMFLHGGLIHLAGNMLYLWIFGSSVEDAMGRGRFLPFYLVCGVVAATTEYLHDPVSVVPVVGASGAVSGVLGAYLVLYPHARVSVLLVFGFLWRLVAVPALVVLGLWVLVQLVSWAVTFGRAGGGVAVLGHVGGFLAGMVLVHLFRRRLPQSRHQRGRAPL